MAEATTARHLLLRMIFECRSDHWTTTWIRLSEWLAAISCCEENFFLDREMSEEEFANDKDFKQLLFKLSSAGLIKTDHVGPPENEKAKMISVEITELGKFLAEADSLPEAIANLKPF